MSVGVYTAAVVFQHARVLQLLRRKGLKIPHRIGPSEARIFPQGSTLRLKVAKGAATWLLAADNAGEEASRSASCGRAPHQCRCVQITLSYNIALCAAPAA